MTTVRTWVSPVGDVHDVSDDELYDFCTRRELHYQNMVAHIKKSTSDQKNNGWRLIDRLRCIGPVKLPLVNVPALGTLDSFHKSCLSADDGRQELRDKGTLGKLLSGTYAGANGWKGWERRILSSAQKRQLLLGSPELSSQRPSAAIPAVELPAAALPNSGAQMVTAFVSPVTPMVVETQDLTVSPSDLRSRLRTRAL